MSNNVALENGEGGVISRQYAMFISYRHADNLEVGRKWANWLHEAVESYEVPEDLIGRTNLRGESVPESLFPVFRDEEELPADADSLLLFLREPAVVAGEGVGEEAVYP